MDNESNEKIEILMENTSISAMDISMGYLIYSIWDENLIKILSLNSNTSKEFIKLENNEFVSSIVIMKSEGKKFLFISLSNGRILFYKFNSKKYNNLNLNKKKILKKINRLFRKEYKNLQIFN
jgi:hypothetical protein